MNRTLPPAILLLVAFLGAAQAAIFGSPTIVFTDGRQMSNTLIAAKNGTTISVIPGDYTNTAALHIASGVAPFMLDRKTNITILGNGARFYFPTGFVMLSISNCQNIDISGLTFEGGARRDATGPTNAALSAPPPTYATNWFNVTYGIWGSIMVNYSEGLNIHGCVLKNGWDHGLLVDTRYGDVHSTNNNRFCENEVTGHGWVWTGAPDGSSIEPMAGWIVSDNYFHDTLRGVEIFPVQAGARWGHGCTVVGNKFHNIWGGAIMVCRDSGSSIIGNTVTRDNDAWAYNDSTETALAMLSCTNVSVADNLFQNYLYGLRPDDVVNCLFSANIFQPRNVSVYMGGGYAIESCQWLGNTFGDSPTGVYGNGTIRWNNYVGNKFLNSGTNNFPIYFNGGTMNSNTFTGNVFFTKFTNAVAASFGSASGVGNIWGNNILQGNYTNAWNLATDIGRFKGEVFHSWGNVGLTITNNTPTHAAGNGSLCLVTDGRLFLRTNGAWLLK